MVKVQRKKGVDRPQQTASLTIVKGFNGTTGWYSVFACWRKLRFCFGGLSSHRRDAGHKGSSFAIVRECPYFRRTFPHPLEC